MFHILRSQTNTAALVYPKGTKLYPKQSLPSTKKLLLDTNLHTKINGIPKSEKICSKDFNLTSSTPCTPFSTSTTSSQSSYGHAFFSIHQSSAQKPIVYMSPYTSAPLHIARMQHPTWRPAQIPTCNQPNQ